MTMESGSCTQSLVRWRIPSSIPLLAFVLQCCLGCSNRPATVYAPKLDAESAADEALSLYDKNGDGALDQAELAACRGVKEAIGQYDTDGNGAVSREELVARMEAWKTTSPAMMSVACRVLLDGRPLSGATVRFVPEPYLQESLKPASGVTGSDGVTSLSLAPEDMPSQLQRVKAMNAGAYKVEITHPSETIPARYNSQTTLGREVSKQTVVSPFDDFHLSRK